MPTLPSGLARCYTGGEHVWHRSGSAWVEAVLPRGVAGVPKGSSLRADGKATGVVQRSPTSAASTG